MSIIVHSKSFRNTNRAFDEYHILAEEIDFWIFRIAESTEPAELNQLYLYASSTYIDRALSFMQRQFKSMYVTGNNRFGANHIHVNDEDRLELEMLIS